MKFVFFKTPKPKKFNYRPRYWDPEAEAMERRKRQLSGDPSKDISPEKARQDLRSELGSRWRRNSPGDIGRSNPWRKLFIYALIIFFSIYFIFFTEFINNLVRFFTE